MLIKAYRESKTSILKHTNLYVGQIWRDEYKSRWKIRAITEDRSGVLICREDNQFRGLTMDGFIKNYKCAEPYHLDDVHHDVNLVYSQYDEGKITSRDVEKSMHEIGKHIVSDFFILNEDKEV